MHAPRLRLFIAAVLFCGWIGWLAYLAATTRNPIVLSRPQLLSSTAHIEVRLEGDEKGPASVVVIKRVLWSPNKPKELEPGKKLVILGLAECGPKQGWNGPGDYILPIFGTPGGMYTLVLIPPSPSYLPENIDDRRRIYPATPAALAQIQTIHATYPPTGK